MTERRFMGMTALALLGAVMCFLDNPSGAVFPSLMILILGFDAVCEARK